MEIFVLGMFSYAIFRELIGLFQAYFWTKFKKIVDLYFDWKSIYEQSTEELQWFVKKHQDYSEPENFLQKNASNLIAPKLIDLSVNIEEFKVLPNLLCKTDKGF